MPPNKVQSRHIITLLELQLARNSTSTMKELVRYLLPKSLKIRSNIRVDREYYTGLITDCLWKSALTMLNLFLPTHLKLKIKSGPWLIRWVFLEMNMILKKWMLSTKLSLKNLSRSVHPSQIAIFTTMGKKLMNLEFSKLKNQQKSPQKLNQLGCLMTRALSLALTLPSNNQLEWETQMLSLKIQWMDTIHFWMINQSSQDYQFSIITSKLWESWPTLTSRAQNTKTNLRIEWKKT